MKKFTKQEIRDLFNQVMHEEISFSRMVEVINERVEEPQFKDGDFLHSDWDDENITIIFKNQVGDNLYYHASKACYYGVAVDNDCYWRDGGDFRLATDTEKQELLDALAKRGQRWNEEKKCIEDIPKRKFKVGDRVRIKDGISSKTHYKISPAFVEEMDKFIRKELIVENCSKGGFVKCDGYYFSEDWLEPYEEPKKGDLAIFWDDDKRLAAIRRYYQSNNGVEYRRHQDIQGLYWANAIKFESIEQYERFIKGEI